MPEIPFYLRFLILILIFSVIAAINALIYKVKATKWQEYAFVLSCGLAGGIFGIINDMITSSISPEYFIFGKGISQGKDFALKVVELGFQAGFFAGAIIGCAFLFANNPWRKREQLSYRDLFILSLRPLGTAILCAPLVSIILSSDIFSIAPSLLGQIPSHKISGFVTVWGIHCGLYLGGALGTVWSVLSIVNRRKKLSSI